MTTTKPPVLTDELDPRLIEWLRARQDWHHVLLDQAAVRQVIAALERAGADAVRDAALEESARELEKRRALLRGQYESVNITEADAMYGLCIDAIRALKVTPAAAVADSMPGWSHWENRIKALMQDMGMSNSHSAYRALAQLANEMGQAHGAAAPQAGQLSGNAGEVEPRPLMVTRTSDNSVMLGFRSCREASVYERAAIAASKGAKP